MSGARQRVDGAKAFLLHAHPYSESSLILDIFARDHGRLALMARGARRPRSALRGVLLAFQPLELGWFGSGDVKTLAKAEWLGGFPLLERRSLLLGYYLNELILKLLPREDAHPGLFDAYAEALGFLGKSGIGESTGLRRFEKNLLRELGYGLALDREAESGRVISVHARYTYLVERGPVLAMGDEALPTVSGKTLLDMAADNFDDPRTASESKTLMRQIINHYLGSQVLQSRRIFVELQDL